MAKVELNISEKTGLITGASSGIGRATALALAKEGVTLVLTARRKDRLDSLANEIVISGGPRPYVIVEDFMAADAAENIAGSAIGFLGHIDILVNNAGGSRAFGAEASEDQWDEALTLNFTRHRQLTGRILPGMFSLGWGRVINITGKSEPDGVNGAFCAKAAVHSWSKGLSREVGLKGVTVNCIAPGRIMSEQIERNYSPEHRERQSREEISVGEYGQPHDIANLICYLSSPLARYITGIMVPVDGGLRRYQF